MPDDGQPAGLPVVYQAHHSVAVHVIRHEVSELLQLRFAGCSERFLARPPVEAAFSGHPLQQGATEAVCLEDTVPGHAERRADPAALCTVAGLEERVASFSPYSPVVDLIPRDFRVPESNGSSLRTPKNLLRCENRLNRQEPEPESFCLATLHTVLDTPAEHLVAAADAERGQGALRPFDERLLEATGAEQFQVLDRRFRSWEDSQVGVQYLFCRFGEAHGDARLVGQGIEVREVADAS